MKRQMDARESLHLKRKSSSGFTLAETLLAVLILLMVTSIVVAGIPAARTAYEKVIVTANAEVLLSTTISALRNELGTAQNMKISKAESATDEKNTVITYYNYNNATSSMICLNENLKDGTVPDCPADGIVIRRFASSALVNNDEGTATRLVTREASDKRENSNLYVTYDSVEHPEAGIIQINDLKVYQMVGEEKRDYVLAERETLFIRVIAE